MKQEGVKKRQTGERIQSLEAAASTQFQPPKPSRNLCPTWLDRFFKSQKSGLRHEISRFFHVGNSLNFKLHDKQNTCVRGNHRLGLPLGTSASKLSLPLHIQLRPAAQWEALLSLLLQGCASLDDIAPSSRMNRKTDFTNEVARAL